MQEDSDVPPFNFELLKTVILHSYCIVMASKKIIVLGLDAKVKVIDARE
jgi:hypothetical protein